MCATVSGHGGRLRTATSALTEHVHVCIDIKTLCDALCEEAERFMQHVSEEELEGHRAQIVDVAEFARLNQPLD